MSEATEVWLPFLGLVTVAVALVLIPAYFVDKYSCGQYAEITGKPTKFAAFECYVKDGDKWYAWAEYKYRLATKGEMK